MPSGGRRKNAGRKPIFKENLVYIRIGVPEPVKRAWKKLDNPTAWARKVITEKLIEEKGE